MIVRAVFAAVLTLSWVEPIEPSAAPTRPPGQAVAMIRAQAPGDFTLVYLPDTQYYSETYPATWWAQVNWIVAHRDSLNIVFVSHLGDLVENRDSTPEWRVASGAMAVLEAAAIPHAIAGGNHDLNAGWGGTTGSWSIYRSWFPASRWSGWPWWGGYYSASTASRASSYQRIVVGDERLLMLHLEFQAPDDVLSWARGVVDAHPGWRALLSTHSYLQPDGTRTTSTQNLRQQGNQGADIWQELVRSRPSIRLVHSGHICGEARSRPLNDAGQPVDEILTDYTCRPNGGDGWLRFYVFRPALGQIEAYTYSPTLNQWDTDAQSQFTLTYTPATPPSAPATPALTASAVSSSQIDLNWSSVASATSYEVERATDSTGPWAPLTTQPAGVTTYAHGGLPPSTTHYYRVRACNAAGCSGWSGTAQATTSGPPTATLTISAGSGTGSGTVMGAGISCTISNGGTTGDCTEDYPTGTVVTLSQTPTSGHSFAGWGGACSGTGACSVTMSQARTVSAGFNPPTPQCTISVGASPTTGGTVGVTSGGTSGACGRSITLEATPNPGWRFVSWSDGNTAAARTLTLDHSASLVGSFARIDITLTVSATDAALDLLGSPRLSPEQRVAFDDFGNRDGAYNVGDFLAFLHRTGQAVSPQLTRELLRRARRAIPDSAGARP